MFTLFYPEGCTPGTRPLRRVVMLTDTEPLSVDPDPLMVKGGQCSRHCPILVQVKPQTHTSGSSIVTGNSTQALSIIQDVPVQLLILKLLNTQNPALQSLWVTVCCYIFMMSLPHRLMVQLLSVLLYYTGRTFGVNPELGPITPPHLKIICSNII